MYAINVPSLEEPHLNPLQRRGLEKIRTLSFVEGGVRLLLNPIA
jgi:hypothetical protein